MERRLSNTVINTAGSYTATTDQILDIVAEVIVEVDEGGRVVAVNHPESAAFSRPPHIGDHLSVVFTPDQARLVHRLLTDRASSGRGTMQTADGHFTVSTTRIDASTSLIVLSDVTSQRLAHQTLIDSLQDKRDVISTIGGKLQQPLLAVLAYAHLLSASDKDGPDGDRGTLVEDMIDQAWTLAGTIENLLAVAHIENGDLQVAQVPVSLAANAAQVIESMGAAGSRISLTGDRTTSAFGDPARFRQIVRNQLANAVTHGEHPVIIHVSGQNKGALLRVIDHGDGIPTATETALNDANPTSPSHNASDPLGLGLWTSVELARLMNGDVSYQRQNGLTILQTRLPLLPKRTA